MTKCQEKQLVDISLLIKRGIAPAYVENGGVLVVNQRCIRDQRVLFGEVRRTDPTKKRIPEDRLLQPLDILVNSTGVGTLGRVGQIKELPEPATVDSHVTIVRADPKKVYPPYLGYALRSNQTAIELLAEGSTGQTELSRTLLQELLVPMPPYEEQRTIAHILGTLDDKIELNRRMNRTLAGIARAIFKSWFVDFDPVIDNAILHGKPIPDEFAKRAEARRGILAQGQRGDASSSPRGRGAGEGVAIYRDLFPDSFQDSPLGKIPKGWEVGRLDTLLELSRDSIKPYEYPTEEFDHYSIPAYDAGGPAREIGDAIRSSKYLVPSSAVLISKLNPHIPRIWFPNVSEGRRSVCSTEFLVCIPREDISREYIYCLLSSSAFLDEFAQMVTGTTGSHQRVRPDAFIAMGVVKPPSGISTAFTKVTGPLFARCAAATEESRNLAGTRDALLPRLLSGRLRVGAGRFSEELSDEA